MPNKIRELKTVLRKAGFVYLPGRGKGSHIVWEHPLLLSPITLSGKDGDDAQPYQEKDVRNALRQLEQLRQEPKDEV